MQSMGIKAECTDCGLPATVVRAVEINRTAYRHGAEFEEDVPVRQDFCQGCDPEAPKSHCEGCDEPRGDVRQVAVKREAGGEWLLARWCPYCRHLAAVAMTGETSHGAAGLEPVVAMRTWTDYREKCRGCARTFRISAELIADTRRNFAVDGRSEAEIAADYDLCLSCTDGEEVPGEHVGGEG